MKKSLIILSFIVVFNCSNDDNTTNCNFLLNVGVNLTVNTNLPQFSQLQFVSEPVKVNGFGNEGVILVRGIGDALLAWDAADPNHSPSACSSLIINGIEGSCDCGDENTYSLITGQLLSNTAQPCTLKPYRVEFVGNNTYIVSN